MQQAHLFISGYVHGVGYRQFVKRTAEQNSVTGWVRNTKDGKVEALLQSSASSDQEAKKDIENVILLCRKGPFLAEVQDVQIIWEPRVENFSSFEIIL